MMKDGSETDRVEAFWEGKMARRRYRTHPRYEDSYLAYLRQDYDEAIDLLEELSGEMPSTAAFLNDLGICWYLAGERARSIECLRKAIRLSGQNSAACINLMYISEPDRFPLRTTERCGYEYRLPSGPVDLSTTRISIIILEYNNPELTLHCLRSLQSVRISAPYEVILIDNSDRSPSCDYATLSGIRDLVYHKNTCNVGFARGCNQGARLATGEFLYFVNNDTRFRKQCVEELARVLVLDRQVGIVGSKLLYENDTIQHAGIVFDYLSGQVKHRRQFAPASDPTADIPLELQAVTGASLMTPRSLFLESGGFCEEYVNGFEDVDYCLRIRRKGLRVVYNPRSILYHLESRSENRSAREEENRRRFQGFWSESLERDDWKYLSEGEQFLLGYTDDPNRTRRHKKVYGLCVYLGRKHPEALSWVPLHCIEAHKHHRFRKFCRYLFDFMMEQGDREAAGAVYGYFRWRQLHRIRYVRHMRRLLQA